MSTPNPITVTKHGLSYRVELDVHYISDEEMQMLRRYITTLNDENDKLREELSKWERLTAGVDLPEYPVTQFKPKDLERENAKLRELVDYMTPIAWYAASERERDRMRELGVEL